jgi:Glycine-zipper domain
MLIEHPAKSEKESPMQRLLTFSLSAAVLLWVIMLSQTAVAGDARYAQYYPSPPPGYGYVPPCQAVTRGPFRGAARGAAGGALFGAIGGNAGKGAAIGAGVGAVAGAVRRGTARASGACY